MDALLDGLKAQNALGPGKVSVIPVDCVDMCEDGPIVRVLPDRKTSRRVSPAWAARLAQDLAKDRRARR
jgi:(2Fe-2S) ferredoxin